MRKLKLFFAAALAVMLCASCVNNSPTIHPGVTPDPTKPPATEAPVETEIPTPDPTDTPAPAQEEFDALGERITGSEHFVRYLTFKNLIVYEEGGDTFLDGVVENSYPEPITCAVDIVYTDDFGRELARARLQTRDGSYMLRLMPGETVVLARILTDMTLTGLDFDLVFDMETGVRPVQ